MEAGLPGAIDRGVAGPLSFIADSGADSRRLWASRGGALIKEQSSSRKMQFAQGGPVSSHYGLLGMLILDTMKLLTLTRRFLH